MKKILTTILMLSIVCSCANNLVETVHIYKPPVDYDVIKLEFSEPMDSAGLFNKDKYFVQSGPSYDQLPIVLEVMWILKPTELPIDSLVYVYVFTEKHIQETEYVIGVTGVTDLAGNVINMGKNYSIYNKGT